MARVRIVTIGLVAVGLLCLGLVIVAAGMVFEYVRDVRAQTPDATMQKAPTADHSLEYYANWQQSSLVEVTGTITQLGTACTVEAHCGMIIDGTSVMYGAGVSAGGQTGERSTNVRFPRGGPKVGQQVRAMVRAYEGGTYSILNCSECYIEDISTDGS